MSSFEFMMVLTSIIIALAMTEILAGVVRILKGELRTWWLHSTYVLAGFIGIQQLFWDLYSYSHRSEWYFADLLFVFVSPCVVYYLAAALLFPSDIDQAKSEGHEPLDLEAHYWRVSRPFFWVLVPLMPLYTLASLRVSDEWLSSVDIYRVSFGLIYVVLAMTQEPVIHKALGIVNIILLSVFVVVELIARSLIG